MTDDLDTPLFASARAAHALSEDSATLRQDVHCILVECHRDRGATALRPDATAEAIAALSEMVARRLGPRIGGSYFPKGSYKGWRERAERDAAIWAEFNGRNHQDVMRKFTISRRLLYSILSRRKRVPG